MNQYLVIGADIVAVLVLALGVYFPRHRRGDLVTSFVAVNLGVLAVTTALTSNLASVGLGLGLFGILSIIRLRSTELGQHEIAYYFVALALGLLGGLGGDSPARSLTLMAVLVAALVVVDGRWLQQRAQQQMVVLDHAVADPEELRDRLELVLGAKVQRAVTLRLDLVNDSTTVDVRYAPRALTREVVDAQIPEQEYVR